MDLEVIRHFSSNPLIFMVAPTLTHADVSCHGEEDRMLAHLGRLCSTSLLVLVLSLSSSAVTSAESTTNLVALDDGIVRVKSAYPMRETIARLKQDIASKGIRFFSEIDQSQLAAGAGVKLRPSTLLVFGNPPLGTLFLKSNPNAGLDWPVRLLVTEEAKGDVWAVYTDFAWLARRHRITTRDDEFKTAAGVIASITSSVTAK
jgi:uncharacterized protein (DUF302 family)